MNNLKIVKSESFGKMDCDFYKNENGEIFVTRTQIGKALEYANPNDAIRILHNRNKERLDKFSISFKLNGVETIFYSAKGIYEICRYSNQPKANDFYDWVYDVLETIRRHGMYATNELLDNPDFAIKILEQLKAEREEKNRLQVTCAEMKPKADYFDNLVERNLLTNLRDTAKEIGIAPSKFNNYLLENDFLYRDSKQKLKPYQTKVAQGLFELKEYINQYNGHSDNQTLVTPKGRETFRLLASEMN